MKLSKILELINGHIICGFDKIENEVNHAFASDLMSDVLTLKSNEFVLLTGLCNTQVIRTAEMADLQMIIFVRDKQVTDDMMELAIENGMLLMTTPYSMFKVSGILYANGVKPIY